MKFTVGKLNLIEKEREKERNLLSSKTVNVTARENYAIFIKSHSYMDDYFPLKIVNITNISFNIA